MFDSISPLHETVILSLVLARPEAVAHACLEAAALESILLPFDSGRQLWTKRGDGQVQRPSTTYY